MEAQTTKCIKRCITANQSYQKLFLFSKGFKLLRNVRGFTKDQTHKHCVTAAPSCKTYTVLVPRGLQHSHVKVSGSGQRSSGFRWISNWRMTLIWPEGEYGGRRRGSLQILGGEGTAANKCLLCPALAWQPIMASALCWWS